MNGVHESFEVPQRADKQTINDLLLKVVKNLQKQIGRYCQVGRKPSSHVLYSPEK